MSHVDDITLRNHVRDGYFGDHTPERLLNVVRATEEINRVRYSPPGVEQLGEVYADITEHMRSHGTLPDGWFDRALTSTRAVETANLYSNAMSRFELTMLQAFDHEVKLNLGVLLDGLQARLKPILTELRAAYAATGTLDLDEPDALTLARAGQDVRDALIGIDGLTRDYLHLRDVQFAVLSRSLPPGNGDSWIRVRQTGILELSELEAPGLPGADLGRFEAVRAVVERDDVWLPTPSQITEQWTRLLDPLAGAVAEVDPNRSNRWGLRDLGDAGQLGLPANGLVQA